MEADTREIRFRDGPIECGAYGVRVPRFAHRGREYEVMVGVAGADEHAFLELSDPVGTQRLHGHGVEVDGAAATSDFVSPSTSSRFTTAMVRRTLRRPPSRSRSAH